MERMNILGSKSKWCHLFRSVLTNASCSTFGDLKVSWPQGSVVWWHSFLSGDVPDSSQLLIWQPRESSSLSHLLCNHACLHSLCKVYQARVYYFKNLLKHTFIKDKTIKLHFMINISLKIYCHIPNSYYFLIHLSLLSRLEVLLNQKKYQIVQSHASFHFIDETPT